MTMAMNPPSELLETMNRTGDEHAAFVNANQVPAWVRTLQADAWSEFQRQGYPTTRDEEWRLTNIQRIKDGGFRWSPQAGHVDSATADVIRMKEHRVDVSLS